MIQQIITFDGGLSTKKSSHLIQRNEGIICENVDLEKGSLYPLSKLVYVDNVPGKHIKLEGDVIITSQAEADDRFYNTYGGRIYWSNLEYGTFGLVRYDDTSVGEDADAPDAPNTAPTNTTSAGQLSADYVYCYTFVDTTGVESAPSDFLTVDLTAGDLQTVLTMPDTNAPADLASRRVYRTGGDNPTFNLLAEVATGTTTYTDNIRDIDVSRIELYTFENTPPPDGLDMLVESNGTFWGAVDEKIYFSRTGSPEYWGLLDYIVLDKECTGLGKFGDNIIAFTRTSAHFISGSTRDTVSIQRLPFNQGCINKHSVVNIDSYTLWTSLDGICIFNGSTIDVLTKKKISWDEFGRVGTLTYDHYDSTFTSWDSGTVGYDIQYAAGYQDKYYGVYNGGLVIVDLSEGLKVSTVAIENIASVAINRGDNLLYIIVEHETSGYDVYYLSRNGELMTATWKTGRIADSTTDVTNHYRYVELDSTPLSIEVFINGVSIASHSGKRKFKLPASSFGKDIQFEITSDTEIRSLKYEYSETKASR